MLALALAAAVAAPAVLAVPAAIERGALLIEGVPPVPPAVVERLAPYLEARSAAFVDWAPDGGLLISTRFGDTHQLHRVAQPLGARHQVTFFDEPVTLAWTSPDRARPGFVYARDRGGDESLQFYWRDAAGGEPRLLTDGASRNTAFRWSNRGDRFVYASTRRDGVSNDLYLGTLDAPPRLLVQASGSWTVLDWSPDDRQLLLSEFRSVLESRLYLADAETGALTWLMPSERPIAYAGARFVRGADGAASGVWFISDRGAEFQRLRRFDFATGRETVLTASTPWDVTGVEASRDGEWLAWTVNEDGSERVHLFDLRRQRELKLAALPAGVLGRGGFSPDGKRFAITVSSARAAGDVLVYELPSGKLTRWTESELGGLDPRRLVEPELVRFPTFDQVAGPQGPEPRRIPAFVHRPPRVEGAPPRRAPVIVSLHGGPESQAQPGFSAQAQHWAVELGYAVVQPNVRGSSGYGRAYLALDDGLKREDAVKDVGALLDWIATQPDLDASRVVVHGGSYGGYLALASLAHYADRLAGGIDVVGISHFGTFLRNTQSYRRDLRRAEYGDERDPLMAAFFDRISPLSNVARMSKPLFVIQGANDPRVPASESRQIVDALRAKGVPVWYLLARDEGHGFKKKPNLDYQQAAVALFLITLRDQ